MSDLIEAFPGPFSERFAPVCQPEDACFIASHVDHEQGFVQDTYLMRPSVQAAPIAITANIARNCN